MGYYGAAGTEHQIRFSQGAPDSVSGCSTRQTEAAFPRNLLLNYAIPESLQIIKLQEESEKEMPFGIH